jgi:hypothetical protein
MADMDLEALRSKSEPYQLRFVSALVGGLLVWVPGWWAMAHGYRAAAIFSGLAFVGIWVYAFSVWMLWANIRARMREARSRSA